MSGRLYLVPGLYDSGPQHWQRHWQRDRAARVIEQRDWQTPTRDEWVRTIEQAISVADEPVVLAAHSLGCATLAYWARVTAYAPLVRGALLVAPSDVEAPSYPPGTKGFTPMPLGRLPFPARVVASTDDPYCTMGRARHFAEAWGAELTVVPNAGHINTTSGHGPWPEGYALLAGWLV
jgi:predicted alpha/beta hydrolase family esterase